MLEQMRGNIRRAEIWIRGFHMLLFAVIYSVVEVVLAAVVVFQFGFVLLSAQRNPALLKFGESLSRFIYEIVLFLTFNTEHKPFPFGDWPTANAPPPTRPSMESGK